MGTVLAPRVAPPLRELRPGERPRRRPSGDELQSGSPMRHADRVTFLDAVVDRVGHAAEWVAGAAGQLSRRYPADDVVVSAGIGWMRLGPQGAPVVDTLFVVTPDAVLFAGSGPQVEPTRVLLSEVVGLDLLEGLALPLEAIEVRIVGDLAVLVGWPTDFREDVLSVLTGGWPPAPPPAEVSAPRNGAAPGGWIPEPTLTPDLAPVRGPAEPVAHADRPFEPRPDADDVRPPAADEPGEPSLVDDTDLADGTDRSAEDEATAATAAVEGEQVSPSPMEPPVFAAHHAVTAEVPLVEIAPEDSSPPVAPDATAGSTFAESDAADGEVPDPSADRAPLIDQFLGELPEHLQETVGEEWPEPFRHVTLIGGTGESSKRRKNVTVTFDDTGLHFATGGLGAWKWDVAPDGVEALEVGGVDELMFTHSLRIGAGSSAMIVKTAAGEELILEVPDIEPHDLRTVLAGCLVRWGRTGAAAGVVTIF